MQQHQDYLQQTIQLAADNVNTGRGGPYGAIIVQNKQIIAACANQVTSTLDPTAHAEVMAIRAACHFVQHFQLPDCILYSSCEPCPMCLGAIYWARLQQVYFACDRHDAANAGFDDGFIYTEIALAPEQRKIPMYSVALTDALLPFTLWKNVASKITY
ncbi:MAG: nucleoside deaminase [Methylococcaceae bacterium]|nr:nucleoside deaminase [Methylococcaceae bacterium]